MTFNDKKCKILHLGRENHGYDYYMNDVKLEKVNHEKDIGVSVTKNLKSSEQCRAEANMAKAVLNQILRSF